MNSIIAAAILALGVIVHALAPKPWSTGEIGGVFYPHNQTAMECANGKCVLIDFKAQTVTFYELERS